MSRNNKNNGGIFGDECNWNRYSGMSAGRIHGKEDGKKRGTRNGGIHGSGGRKGGARQTADQDEKAFEMVGRGAPQEVKEAWMDAAKEVNANGMGIQVNGMMGHIPQMMVQRPNKQLKGETENFGILGGTVESAVQATKEALYDLEHPRVYTPRSIEVQQARIKEGEFYRAFLERLEQL